MWVSQGGCCSGLCILPHPRADRTASCSACSGLCSCSQGPHEHISYWTPNPDQFNNVPNILGLLSIITATLSAPSVYLLSVACWPGVISPRVIGRALGPCAIQLPAPSQFRACEGAGLRSWGSGTGEQQWQVGATETPPPSIPEQYSQRGPQLDSQGPLCLALIWQPWRPPSLWKSIPA